jgi:hypothetical protein
MKAIFKVLACAAALSFFVACGPSVSGNPKEDAKTYVELAKEDPKAAAEFLNEVVKEYGSTTDKYYDFCKAAGVKAVNDAMDMMEDYGL